MEERFERRSTKRQKVAEANVAAQRPEAQMVGSDVTRLRTLKTRARPKKKSHRQMIVLESSEGSVTVSKGTVSSVGEDVVEKEDLWTNVCGPSGI